MLMETYMEWTLGISQDTSSIEVFTSNEGIQFRSIDEVARERPKAPRTSNTRRIVFEGALSSWLPSDPNKYVKGLGICLPKGCLSRHDVFKFINDNGLMVHVPAMVLMRAFFKPNSLLFPAAFKPVGPDIFAYIDYSQTPPTVVIDDKAYLRHTPRGRESNAPDKLIEWLLISKSARSSMRSIHLAASNGEIKIRLPLGDIRIALHGPQVGNDVFVINATLISMTIPAEDSLTETSETMIFHSMANPKRMTKASIAGIKIPLNSDGTTSVTDKEWLLIEPILTLKVSGQKIIHSKRDILNAILSKLSSGIWWAKVQKKGFSTTNLVGAFRNWQMSGLLTQVLEVLNASRSHDRQVESLQE